MLVVLTGSFVITVLFIAWDEFMALEELVELLFVEFVVFLAGSLGFFYENLISDVLFAKF